MSRLRYIVDRPRGPRGGHNDTGPYYTLSSARLSAAPKGEVRYLRANGSYETARAAKPAGTILVVDLDELVSVDANSDELFAWHEARMQHHAAEAQRLRPGVDLSTAEQYLTSADLAELRQALEQHVDALKRGERTWRTKAGRAAEYALELLLRKFFEAGKLG